MTLNIELRKISFSKTLSEETPAYTAQVWVDGRHVADVANRGHGGCDEQHPAKGRSHDDVRALDTLIRTTYPKQTYDAGGETHSYDTDLEVVCHQLLGRWELQKDIRRDLSRYIMFVKPSDGKIYQVKMLADRSQTPKLVEMIKAKHGVHRVLNEMTLEDVVAIYEAKS
jgi:hypothetical protein